MTSRIPEVPPVIAPVSNNEQRPLWSVMIPTYNCIAYVRQTLESVLAQDPGEAMMQIEVIDDCSTDGDVGALVADIGKGRVKFYRQEKNVGSLRNFETCLNRSRGHWVHLLHGDDTVKNGFYEEIESLFNRFPEVGAAFTRNGYIDEKGNIKIPEERHLEEPGIIEDFLIKISQGTILQVVAMVVKRSVYEHLGSFFAVHYGEDWEMWTRIAANYKVAYSPHCLALYRGGQGHTTSISTNSLMTGQNLHDISKVLNIIQNYLPDDKRKALYRNARKSASMHYAKSSNMLYAYSQKAAFVQANGALKMHINIRTVYWVCMLYAMHIKNQFKFKMRNRHQRNLVAEQ